MRQGRGKRGDIGGRNQQCGLPIAHNFRDASDRRRYDGNASNHGFEQCIGRTFRERGQHGKIGSRIVRKHVARIAGQMDFVGNSQGMRGLLNRTALRPFSNDQQPHRRLRKKLAQTGHRLDEKNVGFFQGKTADNQNRFFVFQKSQGSARADSQRGVLREFSPLRVNGVVQDGDAVLGNSLGYQIAGKTPTHNNNLARSAQRPTVQLVIQTQAPIGQRVTVMECNPGNAFPLSAEAHQKMRLDGMRLHDGGLGRSENFAQAGQDPRVKHGALRDAVEHQTFVFDGAGKIVVRGSAAKRRDLDFNGQGRRAELTGESQQVLRRSTDVVGFQERENADHL